MITWKHRWLITPHQLLSITCHWFQEQAIVMEGCPIILNSIPSVSIIFMIRVAKRSKTRITLCIWAKII